jgi:hypothetical protein
VSTDTIEYNSNFTAEVTFKTTEYFKGENLDLTLNFDVLYSNAYVNSTQFTVFDSKSNRTAKQSIFVNETFFPGSYAKNLSLSPGFSEDGFIALTNQNYTIVNFAVNYVQLRAKQQINKSLNVRLFGKLKAEYEQMNSINWYNSSTQNITIQANKGIIQLNSTSVNGSTVLNTTIQTTGYTRLEYNITGINQSTVLLELGDLNSTKQVGYFEIGALKDSQNFSILVDIFNHENVSIVLSLRTRHVPILAVMASNNWEGIDADEPPFRNPEYYMSQVSHRFESIFNVSIIPVVIVEFESISGSDLFVLADEATQAVGKELQLESNTWKTGTGTQEENMGADILIILTNKTMDHLGIVLGAYGNAFNMAINARGSFFEGSYRLPSNLADNLIQHELSHVFGAPDRWTDSDPASIMTKTKPDDIYSDIFTGKFWLTRTDWLEEDIQTMIDRVIWYINEN